MARQYRLEDRIVNEEIIPKGVDWVPTIGAIRLSNALASAYPFPYLEQRPKFKEPMFHTYIMYHVITNVAICVGIIEAIKYFVNQ